MIISGCVAVKNGVILGYPFIESILSLLPACDEFVILEGYSEDDTFYWLEKLKAKYPKKIRLYRAAWPAQSGGGHAIGEMQSRAIKKCRGRWVYLLQADEIMPAGNLSHLRQLCNPNPWRRNFGKLVKGTPAHVRAFEETAEKASAEGKESATIGSGRFRGHKIDLVALRGAEMLAQRFVFNSYYVDFMHVVNNFQNFYFEGYRWSIRFARNRKGLYSGDDGWQLNGLSRLPTGVARLPYPVVHVGYNFPVNTWRKQINHARLYPESQPYQEAARIAEEKLRCYEQDKLPELQTENTLRLPDIIAPLIGQYEYKVREELFDS